MPTLAQLENLRLTAPEPDDTALVRRCRQLVYTDVGDFTVEDLRIMLGQQLGVRSLLPLAVRTLVRDPMAEGDYYRGDLLMAVLRLPHSAWVGYAPDRDALTERLRSFSADDPKLRRAVAEFVSSAR